MGNMHLTDYHRIRKKSWRKNMMRPIVDVTPGVASVTSYNKPRQAIDPLNNGTFSYGRTIAYTRS